MSGSISLADLFALAAQRGVFQQPQQQGPIDFRSRLPPVTPGIDPGMVQRPFGLPFNVPMPNVPLGNLNQTPGIPVLGTLPT